MRRTILAFIAVIFALSAVAPARAQAPNTINTIAGGGVNGTSPTAAYLPQPFSTVRDSNSNTYISVPGLNLVYKVDTTNTLTIFAGTGISGFSGDGGPATQAELSFPQGLAVDKNNNLFIADSNNERIRRVDAATGNITTVAGSEDPFNGNFGGDNGPATNARLNFPTGVAVDGNDDLFITDTFNGAVRRVDGATQIITTIAGGGANAGCSGGAGNTAGFADIIGIAVDGTGNVFVADAGLEIVCEISATTGNVSTYAGTLGNPGTPGAANGDGGPATSAQMDQPNGLAVDSTGNLFITDSGNPKIRKVDTTANHTITTVAGIGFICGTGGISLTEPGCGDGGLATSATFDFPRGVFVDSSNKIIVTDTFNMRVRVIASGTNPAITGFAGGGSGGDGGPATSAIFGVAQTIAVDSNENVLALETNGERIRKIAAAAPNDITTVAGAGVGGATIGPVPLNGNGGPAASATFVNAVAIAQDSAGNSYIVDPGEEVVRVINNQASAITIATVSIQPGDIAIIAGNGLRCGAPGNSVTKPLCGDNGSALSASLLSPQGVAVDGSGNIYISDTRLNTVRVVNNSTGTISTFAGTPGQACTTYPTNCGDFGPPTSALLNIPIGLATFVQGSALVVYIADAGDNVIREVNPNQNAIFPVMFNGLPTFGGDGGEGISASMEQPAAIAVDDQGNIFVGGGADNVVRRMDANAQTIITVAGDVDNLGGGFSGDGGPSTLAQIENFGLAVFKTAQGTHDLFIADSGSNRIRKVNLEPVTSANPATGTTFTFATTLIGQTSDPQFVFLPNAGLDDLVVSNILISNPDFILSNGCSQGAAPLSFGCVLTVNFAPTGTGTGAQTGTLTFTTNDPANPSFTYNLAGTASNTPATLSVTVNPAGAGFAISDPSGINCSSTAGTACGPASFPAGSTVTLTEFPNSGFVFSGWNTTNAPGTSCPGTGACVVTMPPSGGITIGANFSAAPPPGNFVVNLTVLGNGGGSVTSTPADINNTNCTAANSPCAFAFPSTTPSVTLNETPTGAGTVFAGWLGACANSGVGACNLGAAFPGSIAAGAVFSGPVKPFAKGQVFLSTDDGMVFVLDPTAGAVVQVLNSGAVAAGFGHGMTFDSVGNLFVTNDNGSILEFSNQSAGPTLFGNGNCPCDNEAHSVVIDPFGNVIVGEDFIGGSQQPTLLEFAGGAGPSGTPSGTFFPAYDSFSPSTWTEVLDSSDTVAYTEGTQTMKVFDLGEAVQHPDIAANLHGAFALRELPDTTILVADSDRIARVTQAGNVTQTYTVSGVSAVFGNLNLDPDGVTFWTNDELTGIVYRINISSGAVANGSGFNTSLGLNGLLGTRGIGGIAVFGQPASGGADLSVTISGPTTIASGGSGSYSVVATNNGPLAATGVTLSFFVPGGQSIITSGPTGPVGCGRSINIDNGDETFTCNIGAMASGASDTFAYTVAPTGSITLTANIGATAPADPNPANNSASLTATINAATLVSIAVTPNPASVAAGNTLQFTATGTFSDNSTQNLTSTATWSSSNTAVATINTAGLASGVTAGGPVTIKAASGTISGTAQLTVTAPTLVSIAVTPVNSAVFVAETEQFTAIGTLSDNSTQVLTATATWASSKTAVATISATGLATGVSGGTTTISATQSGVTGSTTLTVAAAGTPPSFTSTTLPGGAVGIPYGADMQTLVSGGQQPYTFAITTGSLPTGFTLVATNSGTVQAGHIFNDSPAATGTFTFGVTVTDSTSPTPQTATATISLTIATAPTNTQASLLKGQYAFLSKNFDESGNFQGIAGSLKFDGKGNVTGIVDINSTLDGVTIAAAVTGTYTVGPDNRGVIVLTETGQPGTVTIVVAVGGVYHGVATSATAIGFNDDNGNHKRGSGTLQLQDPTSFTQAAFAGAYASQLTGQSFAGARSVYTGLFTFDASGGLTAFFDVNDGGTTSSGPSTTGTYTGPDANGRIVLTLPAGTAFEDVIYQVSANEWVYQSLNPKSGGNDVGTGLGLRQTNPNSFTTSSIAGPDVLSLNGSSGSGNSFALVGQLTNSLGTITVLADKNDGGNVATNTTTTGTFTMAANGRGVITTSSGTLVVYLATPDSGFAVIQDTSVASGRLQPQQAQPFANTSLGGSYFFGTEEILTSAGGSVDTGVATETGGNALNITDDESHAGGDLQFDQTQVFPTAVAASGRVSLAAGTNNATLGYMTSAAEFQVFDATSDSNHPSIIEARSLLSPPGTPSPATDAVNFPTPVLVGTQVQSAPIPITNTGLGPFTFLVSVVAPDFIANGGTCLNATPVVLQPQETCTLIVTFAPTASTPINTPLNETVSVNTDGTNNITITCTGTAASAGGISVTPSSTVNFGNQLVGTTSGATTTTITNTSTTQTVTINSVTLSPLPNAAGTNPDGFTIVPGEGNCSADTTLQANGGFCVLPVTFGPPAAGAVTSTITVSDSAGSQVITLNGTGTAPTISLNPTSLTFSAAPDTTSAVQTVTVTNSGAAPLHIANVLLGGEDPADFAFVNGTTPCGKGVTVQPQAACTIGVDFTAPSQATFTATVTIASDASNGAQTIPLTGLGVVISIAPPPGGSTTATTNPGGTAVFPLVLSSTGLTGNATLTCASPATPTITCTVVPGTVALTPNGVTHTAIVVNTFCQGTTPSSTSVPGNPTRNLPPAPWLIAIVGLALLANMALTKKRSLRLVMPVAALLLAGIFASSCGSPPKGPAGTTPPGSYPLVITATVGQASSSITLTLNVN